LKQEVPKQLDSSAHRLHTLENRAKDVFGREDKWQKRLQEHTRLLLNAQKTVGMLNSDAQFTGKGWDSLAFVCVLFLCFALLLLLCIIFSYTRIEARTSYFYMPMPN